MERHFERDLQGLRDVLLGMGADAEFMIQTSVQALVEREDGLVEAVLAREEKLDQLSIEVDDRCFTLMTTIQPMATDLRFLVAAIKINSDIERVGDQACSIALRARSLMQLAPLADLVDIPRMADLAQGMVTKALEAFLRRDALQAQAVIQSDDAVDLMRDQAFHRLLGTMRSEPASVPAALNLLLISRNLERIADHATNIAEDVVYIVKGEDVRERGNKERVAGLRKPRD
jgi:phosphate transport system protein